MTDRLHPNKTGLAVGVFLGGWHLVWSLVVLFGWAQPLLDWVFRLHMIQPVFQVVPFSLSMAVGLVLMTFVAGYALGWSFAWVWDRCAKK